MLFYDGNVYDYSCFSYLPIKLPNIFEGSPLISLPGLHTSNTQHVFQSGRLTYIIMPD